MHMSLHAYGYPKIRKKLLAAFKIEKMLGQNMIPWATIDFIRANYGVFYVK